MLVKHQARLQILPAFVKVITSGHSGQEEIINSGSPPRQALATEIPYLPALVSASHRKLNIQSDGAYFQSD